MFLQWWWQDDNVDTCSNSAAWVQAWLVVFDLVLCFAPQSGGCSLNKFFIAFTFSYAFIATVVSILPKIQDGKSWSLMNPMDASWLCVALFAFAMCLFAQWPSLQQLRVYNIACGVVCNITYDVNVLHDRLYWYIFRARWVRKSGKFCFCCRPCPFYFHTYQSTSKDLVFYSDFTTYMLWNVFCLVCSACLGSGWGQC